MRINTHHIPHAATVCFVLSILAVIASWVGSAYYPGSIQNLLSPDGFRWLLNHIVPNFMQAPSLPVVMVLFIGFGVFQESCIVRTAVGVYRGSLPFSYRLRVAYMLSLLVFLLYVVVLFCLMLSPWNFLQSITGSLRHSPFYRGAVLVFSLGIGLVGSVFGYFSGHYKTDADIIRAMAAPYARYATYFVSLFFVAQFFSIVRFTGLADALAVPDAVVTVIYVVCCYLPLVSNLRK